MKIMAALFNLNIDDVHPEGSTGAGDCGGDMEEGVFRHLGTLWKRFPQVKVTLFVTPNWQNRRQPLPLRALRLNPRVWRGEPYRLDKHPRWCQWLRGLPNTEIALHGLTHHAPRGHHAQEFQKLSQAEAHQRLHRADEIHQAAGLPHSRGFRPPGWGWNPDLPPVLQKWNCAYIAASSAT
ncbi:MAG: DUF2334 domain-containing protein, partial [Euryarchaeota archaeon]|nr:DUF2334 domain-containing protein [Euryarchaeota archaeon]